MKRLPVRPITWLVGLRVEEGDLYKKYGIDAEGFPVYEWSGLWLRIKWTSR